MGVDSPVTFDALVARPDGEVGRWAGMAPVEDLDSVIQGVRNGSWLEGGLGFASLGGDVLAAGIDPIGTGLSWAAAWVIEQVTPLREALESVTGSPAKVVARAQTLLNIEASLNHRAEALAAASRSQTWAGSARDAYGVLSGRQIEGVVCLAKGCGTVAVLTEAVGMVVAFVRDTVRDLIADCVAQLVKAGVIALIPGAGTASAIASAVALIARYAAKIGDLLRHLLRSIRNLGPFFRRVEDRIAETIELFRHVTGPALAADGPRTHWMMSGGGSEPPSSGRRTGVTSTSKPPAGTDDLPDAATTPLPDTIRDTTGPVPDDPSALPFPDGSPPWPWDTNPERVVRGEDGRLHTRHNENVPRSGKFEVVDNSPDYSLLRRPVLNDAGELVPPESGKFEIGEGRILAFPLDTPPPPRSPAPPPPSDKYPANWGPYPTDGPSTVPTPPDSVPPPRTPHTPPPHDWMDERGYPHFTGSPKVPELDDVSAFDDFLPGPGSPATSVPTPPAPTTPVSTTPVSTTPVSTTHPPSEKTLPSAADEPLTPPPGSSPPSSGPSGPPQQP